MRRDERGMVTGFAVVFAMALFLFAGLVVDGGMVLVAKREVIDQAESAARAGAQALSTSTYRSSGEVTLEPELARSAAASYLAAAGQQGEVTVNGNEVRVSITKDQPMQILGIGGLGHVTVTGVGVATAEQG